jgi:hypothetical protein
MAWDVRLTHESERWFKGLSDRDAARVASAIDDLTQLGPALARPRADSVKGSRHHNMKELRPLGTNIRCLFAFDHRRQAVVLLGGDKTNNWKGWYRSNIPRADRLYDAHLRDSGQKGTVRWKPGVGRQSAPRER